MRLEHQTRLDNLRQKRRREMNLDPVRATCGDGLGNTDGSLPGTFKVREKSSNGLGIPYDVAGPRSQLVITDGLNVLLYYDERGRKYIGELDPQGELARGVNPAATTQISAQSSGLTQNNIQTLRVQQTPTASLDVIVRGWVVMAYGTISLVSLPNVPFSGFLPSSGERCYALISVLADLSDCEVTTSTPAPLATPLTIADFQECYSGITLDSTPVQYLLLTGDLTSISQDYIDTWPTGLDARQMVNVQQTGLIKLATVTGVNMNTATPTALYTATNRAAIVSHVTVRDPSTSLTTASYSFGANSASFNDIIANATHTELTTSNLYTILTAKAGARTLAVGDVFTVLMNALQGGAASTTMDVWGYLL